MNYLRYAKQHDRPANGVRVGQSSRCMANGWLADGAGWRFARIKPSVSIGRHRRDAVSDVGLLLCALVVERWQAVVSLSYLISRLTRCYQIISSPTQNRSREPLRLILQGIYKGRRFDSKDGQRLRCSRYVEIIIVPEYCNCSS